MEAGGESFAARRARKEAARLSKRKRIEEAGGVRPRGTTSTGINNDDGDGDNVTGDAGDEKRHGFGRERLERSSGAAGSTSGGRTNGGGKHGATTERVTYFRKGGMGEKSEEPSSSSTTERVSRGRGKKDAGDDRGRKSGHATNDGGEQRRRQKQKQKQKQRRVPDHHHAAGNGHHDRDRDRPRHRHRFGRVMERAPCPNRPRRHTLSVAVPGSVVSNCQTRELRTHLVGQIARAAAIYHVDEIVVFDDKLADVSPPRSYHRKHRRDGGRRREEGGEKQRRGDGDGDGDGDGEKEGRGPDADGKEKDKDKDKDAQAQDEDDKPRWSSDPHTFMARVLQYCECPQYLRRHFFPMHPDLQFAGLLSPLDAPHHVRVGERSRYREGVVLDVPHAPSRVGPNGGSYVNVGMRGKPVEIDRVLEPGVRCTVRMDRGAYDEADDAPPGGGDVVRRRGTVVSPSAPREDDGTYWGYSTRLASSIGAVFDECPYEGGYDLKIGTSERGDVTVDDRKFALPQFRHSLVMFGGVAGIEECVDADEGMTLSGSESRCLFNIWVNTCPFQGSRTIRTEEAILLSLARLRPHIAKNAGIGVGGKLLVPKKRQKDESGKKTMNIQDVTFSDEEPSEESDDTASGSD